MNVVLQDLIPIPAIPKSEATHAAGWRFYGGTNAETTVVEPNGKSISYRFSVLGMPVQYTDEAGQSTVYEYDAQKQLTSVIDPLGRETKVQFDGEGKLLSEAGPLNRRTDFSYHPTNQQRTQTTQYLTGVSSSQGGQALSYTPLSSSYAYDPAGNLTSVRDPMGHSASLARDGKGQISGITLMAKAGTAAIPTVREGVPGQIAAASRTIGVQYNAAGDLSQLTDALSQTTGVGNDALGRITQITDALNRSTSQAYDAIDRPTTTTDALGQQSQLQYDSAGRLSAVVNAAGVTIERYGYDGTGRLNRVTDASNQATTLEYNSINQLAAFVDRKGQRFTFSYDERGDVVQLTTPDRSLQATRDAVGRVTELRDASTSVAYRYDEADRIIEEATTTAAGSWKLAYVFDSLDRPLKRTLTSSAMPQPEVTTYTWDNASRLTEQVTAFGPTGNTTEHRTRYTFDDAARLSTCFSQLGTEPPLTQRYFYDEVDRLSRIQYVQSAGLPAEQLLEQIDYSYDAAGQRIAKTTLNNHGSGPLDSPMSAVYDAANRMQSITLKPSADVATHVTYNLSYDANGNMTQKVNAANAADKTTYSWDAQDKLVGLAQTGLAGSGANGAGGRNAVSASYQYDLMGRRIQSSIQVGAVSASNPPQTVAYIYEGDQALGEVRNQTLSHRLLTGLSLDETIARVAVSGVGTAVPSASRQFLTDALNSVIAQANAQGGGVANSYGYSPYGEASTVGPDATGNTAQYTSRENDAQGATGLVFYRARYYDPVLKRFVSEDPIGLAGGENVYAYVGGNPVQFADPEGTIPIAPLVWAYARCIAKCSLESAAMQAFQDGTIECIDPLETAGDCALSCLNPMNWFKKGPVKNANRPGTKRAEYWRKEYEKRENKSWPKTEDGKNYHAHHKDPLADGGKDVYENIEPKHPKEHFDHHAEDRRRWGGRKK